MCVGLCVRMCVFVYMCGWVCVCVHVYLHATITVYEKQFILRIGFLVFSFILHFWGGVAEGKNKKVILHKLGILIKSFLFENF